MAVEKLLKNKSKNRVLRKKSMKGGRNNSRISKKKSRNFRNKRKKLTKKRIYRKRINRKNNMVGGTLKQNNTDGSKYVEAYSLIIDGDLVKTEKPEELSTWHKYLNLKVLQHGESYYTLSEHSGQIVYNGKNLKIKKHPNKGFEILGSYYRTEDDKYTINHFIIPFKFEETLGHKFEYGYNKFTITVKNLKNALEYKDSFYLPNPYLASHETNISIGSQTFDLLEQISLEANPETHNHKIEVKEGFIKSEYYMFCRIYCIDLPKTTIDQNTLKNEELKHNIFDFGNEEEIPLLRKYMFYKQSDINALIGPE